MTGEVDPDARAVERRRAGRATSLFLTKPIGTGIIGTAIKTGARPRPRWRGGRVDAQLNRAAAEALRRCRRRARLHR
ncbi:MAG: hypothetical protein M0C28_46510, partial [Candidatus Moduliflexus flocculans]|nr:hypothetical protein [Candidatus Moduliflexus flocculans]